MKISRTWLQTYFDYPLPEMSTLSDALTFHAFEIDGVENDILDVKVTPNRGHDCLSHLGIAKELAAILKVPLKDDPLRSKAALEPKTDSLSVSLDTPLCNRFTACYIRGVKVGPSPEYLRNALESIGQRSINNIVDATNYVMFGLGQPLHAFDAGQLTKKGDSYALGVRMAKGGEKMLALDDKEYNLTDSMMVVIDPHTDTPVGIAGVKGGKPAGITEATKDIILESANFDGISVRKTSSALKLRTDASIRFEQVLSPEMAAYGIRAVADLILELAGGEIVGFVDEYPKKQEQKMVSVSVDTANRILGTELTGADVADVFTRLGFGYKEEGGIFDVVVPFERLDIVIAEDLVEEVGRIIGYDKVSAVELPAFPKQPEVNANFYAAEALREKLVSEGYSEVITSVFTEKGERLVANKVDGVRPYLRAGLTDGLKDALEKNIRNKDLLGLADVKLFEIGTVWQAGKEVLMLGTIGAKENVSEKALEGREVTAYADLPISSTERYQTFSKYPFIVRDIALWTPTGTNPEDVLAVLRSQSGELLVRSEKFDEYKNEKTGKTSYAFRLVFQSFEKTLTDEEVNAVMEKVNVAVKENGWEVR